MPGRALRGVAIHVYRCPVDADLALLPGATSDILDRSIDLATVQHDNRLL